MKLDITQQREALAGEALNNKEVAIWNVSTAFRSEFSAGRESR